VMYAKDMPAGEFIKGTMYAIAHPEEVTAFMLKGAEGYFEERFHRGHSEVTEITMQFARQLENFKGDAIHLLTLGTRFMDVAAQVLGGYAYVQYQIQQVQKKNPAMSKEDAQKKAFESFIEFSNKTQQSRLGSKISAFQAQRDAGSRYLLAFANATQQLVRLNMNAMISHRHGEISTGEMLKTMFVTDVIQAAIWYSMGGVATALTRSIGGADPEETFEGFMDGLWKHMLLWPLGVVPQAQRIANNMVSAIVQGKKRMSWISIPIADDLETAFRTLANKKDKTFEDFMRAFFLITAPIFPTPMEGILQTKDELTKNQKPKRRRRKQ